MKAILRTKHTTQGPLAVMVGALLALSGCAAGPGQRLPQFLTFTPDPCSASAQVGGALVGLGVGYLVGRKLGHAPGSALAAGVLGAFAGNKTGQEIDKRRCELAKIASRYALQISMTDVVLPPVEQAPTPGPNTAPAGAPAVGLSVEIRDSGAQFESESAEITPAAREYFAAIAHLYLTPTVSGHDTANAKPADRNILLVGHTDDEGGSKLNADLSAKRAYAVANVFEHEGVSRDRLYVQGAGETLPVADNRTPEGRATNRRVQIVDIPDKASLTRYLAARKQNIEYYRPTDETTKPRLSIAKSDFIDFGGIPVSAGYRPADVGRLIKTSESYSIIPTANAAALADSLVPPCAKDRPRLSNGVKSYMDLKEVDVSEFFPGLYGTSWYGSINGNLVGLAHVAVYKDGGSPIGRPDLYVFRHYHGDTNGKPDFSAVPQVNVYRGDKALLYRVFVEGPAQCIDLVFPYVNAGRSEPSSLFYLRADTQYVASFEAKTAR